MAAPSLRLGAGSQFKLRRRRLRGRRPVRADRRLRADENRVRTQSAILDKTPAPCLLSSNNHVFCTDAVFIRTENMVGVQSAQWPLLHFGSAPGASSNCGAGACADGVPSARIADCVRTKTASARNRRSFMTPPCCPCSCPCYAVPPTVSPSRRSVGWPTPTGTLWPSLPQVPTPVSRRMSLPIMRMRFNASGPLPMSVAPLTG